VALVGGLVAGEGMYTRPFQTVGGFLRRGGVSSLHGCVGFSWSLRPSLTARYRGLHTFLKGPWLRSTYRLVKHFGFLDSTGVFIWSLLGAPLSCHAEASLDSSHIDKMI
jgi:hypothetical protein